MGRKKVEDRKAAGEPGYQPLYSSGLTGEMIYQYLKDGLSVPEIARRHDITERTVYRYVKTVSGKLTNQISTMDAGKIVAKELDTVAQLQRINDSVTLIHDTAVAENDKEMVLKASKEIRGQLKLQVEIFQALFDFKGVAQFQQAVMEVIAEVAPEARQEIIKRLRERNAVRSALSRS